MGLLFDEAAPPQDEDRQAIFAGVQAADNRRIHNFALGTLVAYFHLGDLPLAQIDWDGGLLRLTGLPGSSRPRKAFVYAPMAAPALAALQRDYAVYTLDKVGLPKGTKAVETAYYLPQVMDPAAYPNARKRHMRLVQPAKLLARHEVVLRQLSAADLPEIKLLHDAWVRHKLAQPDVMQIMFSKTRYYHCARIALTSPGYLAYGAYQGERLLAVRILYRQAGEAYDLAYFAATWDSFSNLTEALSMQTMRAMQAAGVDYLNCGMGLNKKLGAFKGHWPCEHPVCYAYPQL